MPNMNSVVEQAREITRWMHLKDGNMDNKNIFPYQISQLNRASMLATKMDNLAWLVRFQLQIPRDLQHEMIEAFRDTELPMLDQTAVKAFEVISTGS